MMQVDTACARIPRFIEKASRAGCVQVFIGMESLREDNLQAAAKRQNKVGTYRDSIAQWHEAGVACHVGFIIGFPFDTYDRIMEDVRTLRDEILVDQASFFMLTPLPGSRDHRVAVDAGTRWTPTTTTRFIPRRCRTRGCRRSSGWRPTAMRDQLLPDHMCRSLLRQNPHPWGMFASCTARRSRAPYPMVTGFFRLGSTLAPAGLDREPLAVLPPRPGD